MRLIGRNRASAPWFLNIVADRRAALGWSYCWRSEKFIPAHSSHFNTFGMRPDEFHPNRRLVGGKRHDVDFSFRAGCIYRKPTILDNLQKWKRKNKYRKALV